MPAIKRTQKNTVMSSGVPFQNEDQFDLLRSIIQPEHDIEEEGRTGHHIDEIMTFRGAYKGVPVYFYLDRNGFYDVWLGREDPELVAELRQAAGFKSPKFGGRGEVE